MITAFKNIVAENPAKQTWKHLRLFLDSTYTSRLHCNYLGITPETRASHRKNIGKQADHVAYCIQQAEEYFHASQETSLVTRPLLLYYGAVSLATALVLIKRNGEFSLDRIPEKFKRHGLELKLSGQKRSNVEMFFDAIRYSVSDSGLFGLFYESLVPCVYHVDGEIHDIIPNTFGSETIVKVTNLMNGAGTSAREKTILEQFTLLDLMKMMPDMYFALTDIQIKVSLCRGSIHSWLERHHSSPDHGIKHQHSISVADFLISGLADEQRKRFIDMYQNEPNIRVIPDFGLNTSILRLQSRMTVEQE